MLIYCKVIDRHDSGIPELCPRTYCMFHTDKKEFSYCGLWEMYSDFNVKKEKMSSNSDKIKS